MLHPRISILLSPPKSGSTPNSPDPPPPRKSNATNASVLQLCPSTPSLSLSASEPSTKSSPLKHSHLCSDIEESESSGQTAQSFPCGTPTDASPQLTRSIFETPIDSSPPPSILSNHPILRFFATASKPRNKCESLLEPNGAGERTAAIRADYASGQSPRSTKFSISSKLRRRSIDRVSKKSKLSIQTFPFSPRSIFDIGRQPANDSECPVRHALTEDNVRLHSVMTHSAVTNKATLMRTYLCEQRLHIATLCTMDPESNLPRSVARTNYLLNLTSHSSDSSSAFHKSRPISPCVSDESNDTELESPSLYVMDGAYMGTSDFSRSIIRALYGPKSRLSQLESDFRHGFLSQHVNNKVASQDIQPETLDSLAALYKPINDYFQCTKRDPETAAKRLEEEGHIDVLASPPRSIEGNQQPYPHILSGTTCPQGSRDPPKPPTIDVQHDSSNFLEPSATMPPCKSYDSTNAAEPNNIGKRNLPSKHLWGRFRTFMLHHTSQPDPACTSSPMSVSLGNLFWKTKHRHVAAKDDMFPFPEIGRDFSREDIYYHHNASIYTKRNMPSRGLISFPRRKQRKGRQEPL